jgi:hypothetical protein
MRRYLDLHLELIHHVEQQLDGEVAAAQAAGQGLD